MRGRGSNTFGSITVNGVSVGNHNPASNPFTPPIPQPAANVDNLAACVAALKACVESLIGQRGDASNRAVTFNDLVDYELLSPTAVASPTGKADFAGGGGGGTVETIGSKVTTDDTPPPSPADGDMWWDSGDISGGQLYVWYDDPSADAGQWVVAVNQASGSPGPPGPAGPPGSGGGSTILDGAGPPSLALGADGDYYVDSVGQDLYGPKEAGGTDYAAEESVQSSPVINHNFAGPYRVGNEIKFIVAGQITKGRFHRNSGSATTSRSMYLYNTAGTLVATSNPTVAEIGTGWVQVTFPSPIPVAAGSSYVISYDALDVFDYASVGPPLTNAAHATWTIGRYGSSGSFPSGTVDGTNYAADVIWQPMIFVGASWPLAVPGESGTGGGGIPEAPLDGVAYGRQSAAWTHVLMATNDIVDGGNY
jgi:hypothetical protein